MNRKNLKWKFLYHPWLWWPKISEIIETFIVIYANSGKRMNLETFRWSISTYQKYFFLQHTASDIISAIVTVNVQREANFLLMVFLYFFPCLILVINKSCENLRFYIISYHYHSFWRLKSSELSWTFFAIFS